MFQPIASSSRLQLVDALRGFCLLGIILANIPIPEKTDYLIWDTRSFDQAAQAVMHVLVSTKFITIFSILFGFGFSIQLKRAGENNIQFNRYFLVRMLLLFLIGCIHAYVFWFGDIIRYYAICGMLLLLVHHLSTKRLLRLALFFIVFLTAVVFIANGVLGLQQYTYDYAIATTIFQVDTHAQYLQYNLTIDPMVNFVQDSPITFVSCFGKILFGYWLGRINFFQKERTRLIQKKWIGILFVFGLTSSVLFWMVGKGKIELELPLLWLPFLIAGGLFLHSLFYLASFMSLYHQQPAQRFLSMFAPMGRMALTNYLLQTFFYLLLFYKWTGGPHLYGKLSAVETYLLAGVLFILQTILSHWWLRRHKQGPVEWAWKQATYHLARRNKTDPESETLATLAISSEPVIK